MSLLDKVLNRVPAPEVKAAYGPGVAFFNNDVPMSVFRKTPQENMREYQAVGIRNRWIRAAERVVSHQFGAVPWHLETMDGESVTDDSPPALVEIRNLFEKPYRPLPDDPRNASPRTRAGLWGVTSRHEGLCGSGFWYLDQTTVAAGIPLSFLYINPARMTPVEASGRLIGWMLDADQRGQGTPLEMKNVLHFTLEEPDFGVFPAGLVETAMTSDAVTRYADRHAASQFASGGKLPGVYSPKSEAGILPPDVFSALEKELRQANQDPDATRRSIILRGPIEFTPTAATPEQLDLIGVESMARDDVLALWGVPLSQLGGSPPAGLNSGGTKSYDEAALWQKAVHPRIDRFREVIQFEFLDRIADTIGTQLQMIIDEPVFDDDLPKYELAVKAQGLPLTNEERRALIGLDPFGIDALDKAIVMPMNFVDYASTAPVVEPPPIERPPTDLFPAKANLNTALRRSINRLQPKIKKDVAAFLANQQREIAALVRKNAGHIASKPTDTGAWWKPDEWDAKLAKVLTPYATEIANLTVTQTKQALAPGKADFADLVGNKTLQAILKRVGLRIKGINETTRDRVATAIKEGIEAGDGAAELGDRVEAAAAFDEYRAELIARTESARALNESQIESYREFDVQRVVAIDGDDDEECAQRDGQEFDLDEAMDIEDHPNGTLDWSPVVGEPVAAKAQEAHLPTFGIPQITIPMNFDAMADAMREQTESLKAIAERPNPAPIVNIPPAVVNVSVPEQPATVVNVPAPIVNVTTPEPVKAATDGVQEVRVIEMPTRRSTAIKTVKRDRAGLIVEVTEQEVEE